MYPSQRRLRLLSAIAVIASAGAIAQPPAPKPVAITIHVPAGFEVVPADTRASSVGFLNLFSAVGAGLGPLLGGLWKQSLGTANLMTVAAVICAVTGLLMLGGMKVWFGRDYAKVH